MRDPDRAQAHVGMRQEERGDARSHSSERHQLAIQAVQERDLGKRNEERAEMYNSERTDEVREF